MHARRDVRGLAPTALIRYLECVKLESRSRLNERATTIRHETVPALAELRACDEGVMASYRPTYAQFIEASEAIV